MLFFLFFFAELVYVHSTVQSPLQPLVLQYVCGESRPIFEGEHDDFTNVVEYLDLFNIMCLGPKKE